MEIFNDELDKVTLFSLSFLKFVLCTTIFMPFQALANSSSALRLWLEQGFASKEDVEVGCRMSYGSVTKN